MFCASQKVFLLLMIFTWDLGTAETEAVKRDLIGHQPGVEFLQLGNFGPVSGLPTHPTFAHLGLTPQQSVGFVGILLRNGLLGPYALRLPNGQPLPRDPFAHTLPGPYFGFPSFMLDPYILFLLTHHERYLPYGLGPQGIFGSTGLPKPRPLVNGQNEEAFGKLCFVGLVYRHGDRAPEGSYPNDPYFDVSYWPNGWGQLTKLGKLQQYDLGKWIRHHYWDFLPMKYNASDIYVRSTDVDRTLMSAYCNLAGLYECWNEEDSDGLAWQPIPVHTTPVHQDSVLAAYKKCPAYEELLRSVMKMQEVCQANESYKEVFAKISNHTGLQVKGMRDCLFIYSVLSIQTLHGFRLPDWSKDYYPQPLKDLAEFSFKLPCYTTALKRLKCGPLLKDIVQHMQDKRKGNITQKMWVYSGHDTTVANLMMCLGVYDGYLPPYTATLIFELYRQGDEYFVSISYKTPTNFRILRLPCCDKFCPFHDFERIVNPVLPVDWEKECKM